MTPDVANFRAAAMALTDTVVIAARQAEATAASHREQIEHLVTAMRAQDDALTQLTMPTDARDLTVLPSAAKR